MVAVRTRIARLGPPRRAVGWAGLLLAAQGALVLAVAVWGDVTPRSLAALRHWVYPWVWIDVGLVAVWLTSPASVPTRTRRLATIVAVGYFALLAYVSGIVGPGGGETPIRLVWATIPPGWGPALTYSGDFVRVALVPYRVLGYLALSYLVYATILDATQSAVVGVVGLLSCVSCSWPVLASLAAGVAGGGSGLATAVTSGAYGLSTLVFVATVALLYWRPFGTQS